MLKGESKIMKRNANYEVKQEQFSQWTGMPEGGRCGDQSIQNCIEDGEQNSHHRPGSGHIHCRPSPPN